MNNYFEMESEKADDIVIVVQVQAERSEEHLGDFEPAVVDDEPENKSAGYEILVVV